jgi:lysophospholipase L1-like esterase
MCISKKNMHYNQFVTEELMMIGRRKMALGLLATLVLVFGVAFRHQIKPTLNKLKVEMAVAETKQITDTDWKNKTWNAVGDSITEQNIYPRIVAKSLGLKEINDGVSSSTLAVNNTYLHGKSAYERILKCPDADLWTVFAGTNDWLYKTPIGDINSTDPTTFFGALKSVVSNIKNRPNHPKLILFTPLQSVRNGKNVDGISMDEYRQAIINVGNQYQVPVLDLYDIGGINTQNIKEMTTDGVHPNLYGTEIYAPKIIDAIQSLKFN